eukprot:TRINITY_DN130267_c0_g1_i3.p1 TRINITY_DN130267_c0_g1~~TRINITY_DN130267_c0_g1_i3.p1  ORF type:complete len:158 (-),score=13.90 TRINITY_DN130267_c0_g1_i3:151-624(-)
MFRCKCLTFCSAFLLCSLCYLGCIAAGVSLSVLHFFCVHSVTWDVPLQVYHCLFCISSVFTMLPGMYRCRCLTVCSAFLLCSLCYLGCIAAGVSLSVLHFFCVHSVTWDVSLQVSHCLFCISSVVTLLPGAFRLCDSVVLSVSDSELLWSFLLIYLI